MNINFLMLLVAACILRFLASEAKRAFSKRLVNLLPRKIVHSHLKMLRQYPQDLPNFRARVLPFSALQIAFNALSCVCFVTAIWCFPPTMISSWDLLFMRYGSLLIVPLAFLVDVVAFTRLFLRTFSGKAEMSSDLEEMDEQS